VSSVQLKHLKKALAVFLLLAFGPLILAAGIPDSLSSSVIEPGVTHLRIVKDGPFAINVLVVDLHTQHLQLESYRPVGLVPTSQQAKRNDREGHRVIAAINADFFSYGTGWPVNNQIEGGTFVIGTPAQRSHLILDAQGMPHIQRTSFDGWIRTARGKSFPISGVNDAHRDSALILHNSFSDTATSSVGSGTPISLRLLNAPASIGDTLRMQIVASGGLSLAQISPGDAALWIGKFSAMRLAGETMQVGDTVLIYLGFHPMIRHALTALGGVGMIVADGKPVSDSVNLGEKTNITFLTARHPRTFVGFDRDTTRLFLCVVDGRQPSSLGMNFREMADFLLSIGVWNAVNFDGGGSTTMVVQGKIVNSPSDKTGERPVANTLQLIKLTPTKAKGEIP